MGTPDPYSRDDLPNEEGNEQQNNETQPSNDSGLARPCELEPVTNEAPVQVMVGGLNARVMAIMTGDDCQIHNHATDCVGEDNNFEGASIQFSGKMEISYDEQAKIMIYNLTEGQTAYKIALENCSSLEKTVFAVKNMSIKLENILKEGILKSRTTNDDKVQFTLLNGNWELTSADGEYIFPSTYLTSPLFVEFNASEFRSTSIFEIKNPDQEINELNFNKPSENDKPIVFVEDTDDIPPNDRESGCNINTLSTGDEVLVYFAILLIAVRDKLNRKWLKFLELLISHVGVRSHAELANHHNREIHSEHSEEIEVEDVEELREEESKKEA